MAYGVGALAGSTVLPDKWVTPIIQGIALPAHAQTSAPSQLALAFCNDRVDLTLVAGHSTTGDVTIKATGCLSSAQANVTFNLTLAGYAHPVVTDTGQSAAGGFLAAVSTAFVPSAHAAQQPLCTQVVSVTTGSEGAFEATFTLSCGPGIQQVELTASVGGPGVRAGWLDIPPCNPCGEPVPVDAKCGDQVLVTSSGALHVGETNLGPWSYELRVDPGSFYWVRNETGNDIVYTYTLERCNGESETARGQNFAAYAKRRYCYPRQAFF
ncbi:MAG: hypothetical protein WBM35_11520, partial [Candidatus Electrothrix sp.]